MDDEGGPGVLVAEVVLDGDGEVVQVGGVRGGVESGG